MEYIGIQKKNGGVVEALQQAILSGQIPAGTEMTQNELAESLGVSRMPVREALMILEYQGLIIRLPNNHVKAADLNEDALRQILALGAQLERQAMRALPQDAMLAGDEMLQHRTLRTVLPYPLHRKLLESIQETYIAFAVSARPAPVNDRLSRLLGPVLRRLFPQVAGDRAVMDSISANVSANLLGLGNAATPLGLEAARGMARKSPGVASDSLCMLVVCNTASIQLLPTTVASVRAAFGSAAPFDILPAVWISSLASVTVGLLTARLLSRRKGGPA